MEKWSISQRPSDHLPTILPSITPSIFIWETKIHMYLVTLIFQNQIPRLRCPVTSLFDVTGHQCHYTLSSLMLHPTHHNFSKPWHRSHGIWFCKIDWAFHYKVLEQQRPLYSPICFLMLFPVASRSQRIEGDRRDRVVQVCVWDDIC
jgi:hypothetical protein